MKMKVLCGAAIAALALMSGVVIAQSIQPSYALMATRSTQSAYTCSSINFGMTEPTYSGSKETWSGSGPIALTMGADDNTTIINSNIESYSGETFYHKKNVALKLSKSGVNGSITFNLTSYIIGCDVYAIGWSGKTCKLNIAGDEQTIVSDSSAVSGSGNVTVDFPIYQYNFNKTKTLTLQATERVFIGNIALKIASDQNPNPDPIPVDPEDPPASGETNFTLTSANSITENGITITFAKASGSNAPTWYAAGLRLYANNTVTITSATKNITQIDFNWEKQGSKAFASATANDGSYTHPSNTGTGTWTGSALTVIFTLGSSGQLQLNTLSVTLSA